MTTFLNKLRVVTLGAAHDLLDAKINMDSPSVVRQYTRDLEEAINKLNVEVATEQGHITTLKRRKTELETTIQAGKDKISKFMASTDPNARPLAEAKGKEVLHAQTDLTTVTSDLSSQEVAVAQLSEKVTALKSKHESMVSRVRELERLDRDSKAKESAAKALSQAGSIINAGADISVDDVQQRMQERNDVANAKFTQSLGDIHTDEPDSSDLNALLESLTPTTK